jgi:hypothetical protein
MSYKISEGVAATILNAAVNEGKASDLFHCLIEGGSATVDVETGKLIMVSGNMLQALMKDDTVL